MNSLSRRAFVAGLAGAAASGALHAEEVAAPDLSRNKSKRVSAKVARFRSRHEVPGLSVAFSRKGDIVYSAAFGDADRSAREPLTTRHQFRIALMWDIHAQVIG